MTKKRKRQHRYKEDGIGHVKERQREQNIDRDGMTEAELLRDSERPGLKGRFRGTDRGDRGLGMERQSKAQTGWCRD